jgi:hypothetical protein
MYKKPNAQYNLADPGSMSVRVATRVRSRIFAMFMEEFSPTETDEVLDLGVTSDQSYESSNYFESLYPYKNRITAAGIDDASFLSDTYPGVRFQFADALNLPFDASTFGRTSRGQPPYLRAGITAWAESNLTPLAPLAARQTRPPVRRGRQSLCLSRAIFERFYLDRSDR